MSAVLPPWVTDAIERAFADGETHTVIVQLRGRRAWLTIDGARIPEPPPRVEAPGAPPMETKG